MWPAILQRTSRRGAGCSRAAPKRPRRSRRLRAGRCRATSTAGVVCQRQRPLSRDGRARHGSRTATPDATVRSALQEPACRSTPACFPTSASSVAMSRVYSNSLGSCITETASLTANDAEATTDETPFAAHRSRHFQPADERRVVLGCQRGQRTSGSRPRRPYCAAGGDAATWRRSRGSAASIAPSGDRCRAAAEAIFSREVGRGAGNRL
jgi:hypothetical protein